MKYSGNSIVDDKMVALELIMDRLDSESFVCDIPISNANQKNLNSLYVT